MRGTPSLFPCCLLYQVMRVPSRMPASADRHRPSLCGLSVRSLPPVILTHFDPRTNISLVEVPFLTSLPIQYSRGHSRKTFKV